MAHSRQRQSCNDRDEGEVYKSIRGDQWCEQIDIKEERERPRGVPLYLEERYKHVAEKMANFDSFFMVIQDVLDKYIDLFNTKLRKSMNIEPVELNVREGSKPRACYSCRPKPAHYREVAQKLVRGLLVLRGSQVLRGEQEQDIN